MSGLVDAYLTLHAQLRPVDATFMGLPGHDGRLPPASADTAQQERSALDELRRELSAAVPENAAETLDARLLGAQLTHLQAELDRAPRFGNPAWYSGEAAFGIISLLLPRPEVEAGSAQEALEARLRDLPRFLEEAQLHLPASPLPVDWARRAALEAASLATFLREDVWKHPLLDASSLTLRAAAESAAAASEAFAGQLRGPLSGDPDAPVACGEAHLELLMRRVHGLPFGPREALAQAEAAYARLSAELEADARPFGEDWRRVIARLDEVRPEPEQLIGTYRHWHERALAAADEAGLMTGAAEYGLDFRPMPEWAERVSKDLYFLFYRSPAPFRPGGGSVYWVTRDAAPPSVSFIKLVHAVHHGSIGHHTHNARARHAASRLARLGGTDCASGIAMLSAGTAVEGWACYAEDLLLEAGDFYTPEEALLLKSFERRNAACCIADIKLHLGEWTLGEMRAFYQNDVGFPPARVWNETTRNSLFPATRLMYWLGTEQIRAARAESGLSTRDFHDRLLSLGHAPIHWLSETLHKEPA